MKTSTKIALVAAALMGTLGFSGLMRSVYAKQSPSAIAVMPQHSGRTLVAQVSDGDGEAKDDVEDHKEAAQLQSLAKISLQQAQQAAESAVGGKASSIELENEDGNLVYEVSIGQKEVIVDAGNGTVLYTENANQEDDKNEASRPKSSIQIADTEDGDGEVNDGY